MHENRETSEAPAAQPASRSAGEGNSRAARAYVAEESDSGIVPNEPFEQRREFVGGEWGGKPSRKEQALCGVRSPKPEAIPMPATQDGRRQAMITSEEGIFQT